VILDRPAARPPRFVGLLLVAPALLLLLWSYVIPTVSVLWTSFHRAVLLEPGSGPSVGTRNYSATFRDGFWGSVGHALLLAIGPLILIALVAPLLAWAAHTAGTAARWAVRGLLALPMACFAPVALALGWALDHRADYGNHAPAALTVAVLYTTAGLVTGVGVTLFLAALRRREPGRPPLAALGVVWALGVLTVLAVALQQFTFPYVVTYGGPNNSTRTPMLLIVQEAYQRFEVGVGAASAILVLLIVGLLGTAATVLIVFSRARLEVDPGYRSAEQASSWTAGRLVAAVLAGIGVLGVFVVAVVGVLPALGHAVTSRDELSQGGSAGTVLVNTWLPPLISTVVGVAVALLAGLGIGVFRPLGRWSMALLLPFGPWLFVGSGLLAVPKVISSGTAGSEPAALLRLVPPVLVTIPAVFVFALLFAGLYRRRAGSAGAGGPARGYLLPVLPMVTLVAGVTWLVQAQDLLWPYTMLQEMKYGTAPLLLAAGNVEFRNSPDALPFGLALPPVLVVVLVLAALALQLAYLDRVALRVGGPAPDERPPALP
jgi:ABC-type sugar transport system permease subunit